ncbi:DUF3617 domain-containing protein [Chenggangzhangella methanolivorans]|uniref:DUF3617 domain-containing protein n=1 Tax=Chenggangzhangella methanolivorans TaxID=1437009 RepID=A0A9E6R8M7_9HYPH|nr:DUF3617 domain-containing protein [Chenggangzhangella methanolivorans]QZO00233.1 DUF3617 domain-containing protein [Chenggangzhangella methanolivorans]
MRSLGRGFAFALSATLASPVLAQNPAVPDGLYEVEYRLDLPHLENHDVQTRKVCLKDVGGGSAFPVLSANNPLAACPADKLKREGADVSFEIRCPGGGAARGLALYSIMADRFQGSIAMTMGGKNMTMTEVQRGKRVGDCEAAAPTN